MPNNLPSQLHFPVKYLKWSQNDMKIIVMQKKRMSTHNKQTMVWLENINDSYISSVGRSVGHIAAEVVFNLKKYIVLKIRIDIFYMIF